MFYSQHFQKLNMIDFIERPSITCSPKTTHSEHEKRIINAEIEKLLQKGVIIKCGREDNDFVSVH